MPKLLRLDSLRHCMRQFPRQNFCIYKCIHKKYFLQASASMTFKNSFSALSLPYASQTSSKQYLNDFPEPKNTFAQVINEAFILNQNLDLTPSISYEQMLFGDKNNFAWKVTLSMKWPQNFSVEAVSSRKTEAENMAFANACQELKKFGVLDSSNKPVLPKSGININDQHVKMAKCDLMNVFQRIWIRHGKKEYIPRFKAISVDGIFGGLKFWKSELHFSYPENKVFEASAVRLRDAENIAAVKALQWLIEQKIINNSRRLIQYNKEEEKKLQEVHSAPYSICIPSELQDKMQEVLADIEKQKSLVNSSTCSDEVTQKKLFPLLNIFSDKEYIELTEEQKYTRNQKLLQKLNFFENSSNIDVMEMRTARSSLPISQKREDILKIIEENQVIVLSGETGCGKSTQVPQFILDHYIKQMKGSECNIVVTQPRRISAVSIAERVANERGEKIGETVGYHIRLSKALPSGDGAILYCTTGLLLRKLYSNPNLIGVSHVIIDEVHERNNLIDFTLVLLKDVLKNNKGLKLLLMSATFNTELFSRYFNNCPIISVPGIVYPVKEYFLEDFQNIVSNFKTDDQRGPLFDPDLVVDVIKMISRTQPPGAVLCFLPGWHEIRSVHSKLLDNEEVSSELLICPIHSRLPQGEQKNIFVRPPQGKRKVILATNVAETSVTVNDVVYVVDSGLQKATSLDTEIGISSLSTQWITKANVRQRRGRAGRVQSGVCYHLFSRKTFMKMDEYPVPEILRIPLEKVILDIKLYCQEVKAKDFLSRALQSPSEDSIQSGINELQVLGVLDGEENVTDLGKVIARFSTHPRLSVALVYAAFLGCLDPVLTICAILTLEKEPFINTLDDKYKIKKIKQMHDNGLCSDHLALNKIYVTWESLNKETDGETGTVEYIEKHLLDSQSLERISQLKELFAEDLCDAGIIEDFSLYNNIYSEWNINSSHIPSILAVLTAAFYPNVVKIIQGEIKQGKLSKDSIIYSVIKGHKAYIQKESVVSEEEELPSPWLVYFSAMKSEARRLAMMSSVSSVPGIGFLLLAGRDITMKSQAEENKGDSALLLIDNYRKLTFSCSEREARLLIDWRECFQDMFKVYVQSLGKRHSEKIELMLLCKNKFLPVMKEIFATPQVPFTKGQTYEFVENNLVTKEL